MINILLLIIGLIFGTICSIEAKKRGKLPENWFTLGLIFWFVPLLFLYKLPQLSQPAIEERN